MEVQQWRIPSSLLEEEEALSTVRLSSDQPFTRAPWATLYSGAQGYNVHLGVDAICYRQGDDLLPCLTFPLIALDGTSHPCTLYLLELDLSTVAESTVLNTMVVGRPPLCTLSLIHLKHIYNF
jgi:hypothetical protein